MKERRPTRGNEFAHWRSLDEREQPAGAPTPEFPDDADRPHAIARRELFKLLGASMALAGTTACRSADPEKILPYTMRPRDITPGLPQHYATSMVLDGHATGLLVTSHTGRPTKIEGNPDHPASLGAAGVYEQASVLGLYDPDRARGMRRHGGVATLDTFFARFGVARPDRGAGLRFVLEPTSSPLDAELIQRIRSRFPDARFVFHSAIDHGNALAGARLAFGREVQPVYDVSRALVIASLDGDFLDAMPFRLRYAKQFAERRRPPAQGGAMNRLYVAETMLTATGTMADHRLRRRPSEIAHLAAALAAHLFEARGRDATRAVPASVASAIAALRGADPDPRLAVVARDLARAGPAGLVVVGERQPPEVHALGHVMNALLANDDALALIAPTLVSADAATTDLATVAREIAEGRIDTLVLIGGNPAYTAPGDLDFGNAIARVAETVYVGLYENETAARCRWFLPLAHYLESWGDARAYDGTLSTIQPLIEPLYGGRTVAEILAVFTGERLPDAYRLLRESWAAQWTRPDFDEFWNESIQRGVVPNTASPQERVRLDPAGIADASRRIAASPATPRATLELAFAQDPSVYDGRFANNGWLLELPRPNTKLTWDNAAMMAPATASRLGLASEDVVELMAFGRKVSAPVLIVPGHAEEAVTVHLGYGRTGTEQLAAGVGFDAYLLRPSTSLAFTPGLVVRKLPGAHHALAITQGHWSTEARPIALAATLAEYRANPNAVGEPKERQLKLYEPFPAHGEQWAMTVDLSICTGCSACVVACQAENNILIVGKEQVAKSREMHWLRIDTYYRGDPAEPKAVHEPMMCQHCEQAPCEYVCPVNATVHSPDGLNEMVYNRCVGTRFCSNNCAWKVRRFNWFNWYDHTAANRGQVMLQRNPNVTVRERGVMEKCTYCVQRIRAAEIRASIERRAIGPNEVISACAQACPTGAIQFGSLTHANTSVVAWRNEPRAFSVLGEIGTNPRTKYLARIDNPNPEMP